MRRCATMFALGLLQVGLLSIASSGYAQSFGAACTDRFGYTGTAVYYPTQSDYLGATNGTTINIGDRDLSLYILNGYDSGNMTIVMGSWWYTTDPSGIPGYGNTHGNTGIGFLQLYDPTAATTTNASMGFSGFDGTNWTTFNLAVSGANADYDNAYARFSLQSNTDDAGIYLSYDLDLTATGLNGTYEDGAITSTDQPTGVTGTYTGVFESTSSNPATAGYYVFDLNLDMTNWAYANRDSLTGPYQFADSVFSAAAIPEPGTLALLVVGGLTALAAAWMRRRRTAN
ncbi:MAG: PEP-CTERM sorting domain-containing protein [Thermoguttaceae bacterium]